MSAPVADSVTAVPAQIVALDADTSGNAFTSIVMVSVVALIQFVDSPITV